MQLQVQRPAARSGAPQLAIGLSTVSVSCNTENAPAETSVPPVTALSCTTAACAALL